MQRIAIRNDQYIRSNTIAMRRLAEQSQRESEEVRKLADASRRDAREMKRLATLTMLYLPATFVAVSLHGQCLITSNNY